MESYKIITEKFEGPLDLLLHLINKDEIDIYDIPVASVTEQYLAYISAMREFDIDLASEFLLMAAVLLQIKSRMLLPKQTVESDGAEEDATETDPRQELVERLTVYRQFKLMGEQLAELFDNSALYAVRQPLFINTPNKLPTTLSVQDLLLAISSFFEVKNEDIAYIQADEINIQDKISDILHLLRIKDELTLEQSLIRSGSLSELVASFLAVLELLRTGKIRIIQPEKFGSIYLLGARQDVL